MVRWSVPAKNDLKKIFDYLAKDSKYYAKKVTNEIVDKTILLNKFPQMGRIVPEINELNIREFFIYSYRLIYEIENNNIEILAIVHGKRDFSSGDIEKLQK